MTNRALITGATGYLGSHLARRLVNDGWVVHIVSRKESTIPSYGEFSAIVNHVHDGSTEGMVRCIEMAKPDVVFHLAAMVMAQHDAKDIEPLIRVNVQFATQLVEGMRVNGVTKLVNTGTFWQHYNNETYNPVCLYAATKQAFESILDYYVQACGFEAISLMLFDNYGPNDYRPKLFNFLNKAAKSNEPLEMSPGDQLIDLVYIDDVVEAYVVAAHQLLSGKVLHHEQYAVSSGHPIQLRDLVRLYSELLSKPLHVYWGARPHRYREVMVPWNNGNSLPGWKPSVSLHEGIKAVISSAIDK